MSNWFKKIAFTLDGRSMYFHQNVADPNGHLYYKDNVYQSKDFPHVFLGGGDIDDIHQAEAIAGAPICARIDVTTDDVLPEMPPMIKTPLPEYKHWAAEQFEATQKEFNRTADQVCSIITSNKCPIYVHCTAGINRSVSILSAAISKITGRPLNDVLNEMKSQRFQIGPHDAYYLMALEYSSNDPALIQQVRQKMDLDQDQMDPYVAKIPWGIPTNQTTQPASRPSPV